MSICKMAKILIVSHRSESTDLLENLQEAGICQILSAEESIISKEYPELTNAADRPKETEAFLNKVSGSIDFLKEHARADQDVSSVFAPKTIVDNDYYNKVISDSDLSDILDECSETQGQIDSIKDKIEKLKSQLEMLEPWRSLEINLEEINSMENATCSTGFISERHFDEFFENVSAAGAIVEKIGAKGTQIACMVVCLNDYTNDVIKIMRSADFENANFSGLKGQVGSIISETSAELTETQKELEEKILKTQELADKMLELKTLSDHYTNLLDREQTKSEIASTDQTVLMEGWIRTKDIKKLEKIISSFESSCFKRIEPAEDEVVPMEIANNKMVKPFETITRLHGMPTLGDVDPTVFLAPFFALFFGICLTDAGYGIVMTLAAWWLIKKLQGDKGAIWMFLACSIMTVVAGALTGGWFGDTIDQFFPSLLGLKQSIMLFDPMKEPMTFVLISVGLGYAQILFALCIGFINNIIQKDYATALFNYLVWLIFLNCLLVFALAKAEMVSPKVGSIASWIAIVQAVIIFLFTERKSGMAGRIGGGFFALFSTVFYFGDVLSYVRLMALGMVTAGLGMAINILVKLLMDVPYIGWILGLGLFIGGHVINMLLSILSSFVHSLRLQFVEFFPKFFTGGGKQFKPFTLSYKHILVKKK